MTSTEASDKTDDKKARVVSLGTAKFEGQMGYRNHKLFKTAGLEEMLKERLDVWNPSNVAEFEQAFRAGWALGDPFE